MNMQHLAPYVEAPAARANYSHRLAGIPSLEPVATRME
jgi:hypothetical protein